MLADAHHRGRRDEVTLVTGQVEHETVGLLGGQGVPHALEVRQRSRGEVIALGGLGIHAMELRQVAALAADDLDAGLGGLLDVAAPLLVHAGEDVGFRAADERDLEVELRLPGGEPVLGGDLLPAEAAEGRRHGEGAVVAYVGGYVRQRREHRVGDRLLDGRGVPAAGDDGRAHADAERALLLEVGGERRQPTTEIWIRPVDVRTLGQVGEVALDPRELAIEHERRADQGRTVEPADGLAPPLVLDRRPGRGLQEAHRRPTAYEVEVLRCADGPDSEGP